MNRSPLAGFQPLGDIIYQRADRILRIEVEPGDNLAVYLTNAAKQLFVSDSDLATIRTDIEEALQFMGVQYEIS